MPINSDPAKGFEENLQNLLSRERRRLEREAGITPERLVHFRRPTEKAFTTDQRATTTL
jgi:hypothetical protein